MTPALHPCPRCLQDPPAADRVGQAPTVTCRHCGADFALAVPPGIPSPAPPGRITTEAEPGTRLSIAWRWRRLQNLPLALLAGSFDALMLVSIALALSGRLGPGVSIIIYPILIGLVLSYLALAEFINRTRITCTGDDLVIRHGPFPWKGGFRLDLGTVAGFTRVSYRGRRLAPGWAVAAIQDGEALVLVNSLEADEAAWLACALETLRRG